MEGSEEIAGVSGAKNEPALRLLIAKTGYPLEQKPGTGQRVFGPDPNGGQPDQGGKGCEVFVGKIPRDCFEDELVPVFEKCGRIYELRLMMDFHGENRGFCFVSYLSSESARRAIRELNGYEIRRGRYLGVTYSVDNCRLFIGGIPREKTQLEVEEALQQFVPEMIECIVKSDPIDKSKNRGFAFVEFLSHHGAAMARRKLVSKSVRLFDHSIAVDWAEPEALVDDDVMSKVKVLYFRNLSPTTSEQTIEGACLKLVGGLRAKIERVKKMTDYAFVHFKERSDAELCLNQLHGSTLDGVQIEVVWAKPAEKKETEESQTPVCEIALLTSSGAIYYPPSIDPKLSPRNQLVMGTRDCSRGRSRGAGGVGRVYSRTPAKKLCYEPKISAFPQYTCVGAAAVLEEICLTRGWGKPIYEYKIVHSAENDKLITKYLFLVHIPSLPTVSFVPASPSSTAEDAANAAAYIALSQIGENMTSQTSQPPPLMMHVAANHVTDQICAPAYAAVPTQTHIYAPNLTAAHHQNFATTAALLQPQMPFQIYMQQQVQSPQIVQWPISITQQMAAPIFEQY